MLPLRRPICFRTDDRPLGMRAVNDAQQASNDLEWRRSASAAPHVLAATALTVSVA
jgi:hypothetical protein